LLPNFIIELKDKLLDACDIKSRVNIANKMLLEYYCHVEHSKIKIPINEIDNYIVSKRGVININELASYFNCSVSKLERNFKELAGLTPKTYAKLIRLRNAIRLTAKIDDLMDITYSLGYYDQAHFIKEFKSFVGESPLKYRNSTRNYTKEFFRNNARELVNL
jgi:AraC-like DNA-binding protein